MNRCTKAFFSASLSAVLGAVWVGAAALASTPAQAQAGRIFPMQVERGVITFTAPPEVALNGRTERLAPGVRVRNEHNMVALTGTLIGKTFVVNYLRDPAGVVREIWILTPEERRTLPDGSPAPGMRPNDIYQGG
ncbi:MAG: hypothetical protein Q4D74_03250 [Comamonadaceae bacterium]|nr:hypothetical protein [Comamonadaceae bacterium]RRD57993.1 hypothetical protein EII20_04510 [Comamonadaceae bacterium OH2545_COT-014]